MQFHDIPVLDLVLGAGLLAIEDAFSPNAGNFKIPGDVQVHLPRDVLHGAAVTNGCGRLLVSFSSSMTRLGECAILG